MAAGRTARVIANGTTDVGNVKQAIEAIEPTADVGDLGDALRLASALAARSADAEILVATDAALATPPQGTLEAPVRVLQVGREAKNQAIVALAIRTSPDGSRTPRSSRREPRPDGLQRRLSSTPTASCATQVLNLEPQRRTDSRSTTSTTPTTPHR